MTDSMTILGWTALLFLGFLVAGGLELALAVLVGRVLAGPRRGLSPQNSLPVHRDLIDPILWTETGAERGTEEEQELYVD